MYLQYLGPEATCEMFFSWWMAEMQETKPNYVSTHPSTNSSLSKARHMAKPHINGMVNKLFSLVRDIKK